MQAGQNVTGYQCVENHEENQGYNIIAA